MRGPRGVTAELVLEFDHPTTAQGPTEYEQRSWTVGNGGHHINPRRMPKTTPQPLIHINAFPGTGKLTVAQYLLSRSPPSANVKLVHNHLLINPADAVLHRTQPGYQSLRRALRAATFTSLATEPATYNTTYLFTDFQTTNEQGTSVCLEYAQAAKDRGCVLIPIVLSCDEDANLKRIMHSDREMHAKLMDVELLRTFRKGAPVFRFSDRKEFLEIDVTCLEPEEVARMIWEHVLVVCPELEE
ncbi:hypothetical protein BDV28DRAFT_126014 [Aspergillus coremiiformis]|uniref:P-loop containing nucleoside triphosphate hydrolase protein n=1 Tax=Aspergillus coremiiformis TaxID=138285 RepID=A0A5N6ZH28_9EURO|nr:hypothetical protein BDV28DRAFT_126014 [Aspergillus coremiiformis]